MSELSVFRALVLWMHDNNENPAENTNSTAQEIWNNHLNQFGNWMNGSSTTVESSLPTEDKVNTSFPNASYLYLAPIISDQIMVPRIRISCDFGRLKPSVRCSVEIFTLDNKEEEIKIKVFKYRFETPEGPGIHNYYHIQNIKTKDIGWIPTGQPAFPMDANNSVQLLICLLLSLYGLDIIPKMEQDIKGIQQYIRGTMFFDSLNTTNLNYWKVHNPNPGKGGSVFLTDYDEEEFKDHVNNNIQGHQITGITKSHFEGAPRRQRKKLMK